MGVLLRSSLMFGKAGSTGMSAFLPPFIFPSPVFPKASIRYRGTVPSLFTAIPGSDPFWPVIFSWRMATRMWQTSKAGSIVGPVRSIPEFPVTAWSREGGLLPLF